MKYTEDLNLQYIKLKRCRDYLQNSYSYIKQFRNNNNYSNRQKIDYIHQALSDTYQNNNGTLSERFYDAVSFTAYYKTYFTSVDSYQQALYQSGSQRAQRIDENFLAVKNSKLNLSKYQNQFYQKYGKKIQSEKQNFRSYLIKRHNSAISQKNRLDML